MMNCARHGNTDLLHLLHDFNAHLDLQDMTGKTAIMHAVMEDRLACARLLIEWDADVTITDNNGAAEYECRCSSGAGPSAAAGAPPAVLAPAVHVSAAGSSA